jgi:hypothetical protein
MDRPAARYAGVMLNRRCIAVRANDCEMRNDMSTRASANAAMCIRKEMTQI